MKNMKKKKLLFTSPIFFEDLDKAMNTHIKKRITSKPKKKIKPQRKKGRDK